MEIPNAATLPWICSIFWPPTTETHKALFSGTYAKAISVILTPVAANISLDVSQVRTGLTPSSKGNTVEAPRQRRVSSTDLLHYFERRHGASIVRGRDVHAAVVLYHAGGVSGSTNMVVGLLTLDYVLSRRVNSDKTGAETRMRREIMRARLR